MSNQLNLFEESRNSRYKRYYDIFYKGVKERYERERRAKQINKYERISILIKPIKTKEQ